MRRAEAGRSRAAEPVGARAAVKDALERTLAERIGRLLTPLTAIEVAARDPQSGAALRALALRLVEAGGVLPRGAAPDALAPPQREQLRGLGVRIGALDLYHPALLRAAPLALWMALARVWGIAPPVCPETFAPVLKVTGALAGYRALGGESLRVDLAEKLLRAAHAKRVTAPRRRFALDPALAVSMGLSTAGYARLLRLAGFEVRAPRPVEPDRYGPPGPPLWQWHPPRPRQPAPPPAAPRPTSGAFAALSVWAAE